ncbi:hypothetical protein [Pantoea ananatis]|uniref:hypothetical protein n=1 Tax=Pantoea ananas TaxID=553 RepID=UPI00126930FF|nr:hypothetical protein [Pantoea ananatis]
MMNDDNDEENKGKEGFLQRVGDWFLDKFGDFDYLLSEYKGVINVFELLLWLVFLNFIFERNLDEYKFYGKIESFGSIWWSTPLIIKTGMFWLLPLAFTMVYRIAPFFAAVLRIFSIKLSPTFSERYAAQREEQKAKKNLSKSQLAEKYILDLVSSSSELSRDIYSKGSVYLLFGVLFSIGGLLFFYLQIHSVKLDGNLTNALLTMAPNFGVLLFLEFISFFFLKQYRASMDDFKYYEAVKRSREETLAIIKLLSIKNPDVDYLPILDKLNFSSEVGKLESGQTTELIEARKYDKNEMDVLAKVVEAISKKN